MNSDAGASHKKVGDQVHDRGDSPPVFGPSSRLVARIVAEMQLAGIMDAVRTVEEHLGEPIAFDRALFLLMIVRECPPFSVASAGHACRAANPASGISINAIAMSLDRPFETVRRHVNALIDSGLCTRAGQGVIVCAAPMAHPRFVALLRVLHDRMVGLIEDLARDVPMPPTRAASVYRPDATTAVAIDLLLAPFEYLGGHYGSWLELVIVHAVVIASVRRVTRDPALSRLYAEVDTVPPAALRDPVPVAALARSLRMSYSTVRREVAAAVAASKLVRVPGGVRATAAFLGDVAISRGGQLAASRTTRLIRRLGPGGFRFDDPAQCYLDAKPPPIAFG